MPDELFTIQIKDTEIQKALDDLARKSSNLHAVMNAIGIALVKTTKERFESTKTAPDGVDGKNGNRLPSRSKRREASRSSVSSSNPMNSKTRSIIRPNRCR